MATGWKKYGGVQQMNQLNNVSVYSIASDVLTLRQGYYGAFDICGELHVSDTARFDSTIKGKNLLIEEDISANRLFVDSITVHNSDVSIFGNLHVSAGDVFLLNSLDIKGNAYVGDAIYLGNTLTTYLYGTDTTGNIGINTLSPIATLDISSSYPFALNIANHQGNEIYSAFQTKQHHSVIIRATEPTAQVEFYVDTPFSQSSQPDGKIQYQTGGILNIDVSDNTNILSRATITNRYADNITTPPHLLGETVAIYDISAGVYQPDVYDNSAAITGDALTLISSSTDANTFMNIVAPDKRGLSIGGGAYSANGQMERSMGTVGLTDNSANYTPTLNLVSGSSHTHHKTTLGVNTHAPRVDDYVLDINGPVHINNGEITVVQKTDFEIMRVAVGRDSPQFAIAIGTPHTDTNPYKQKWIYTADRGETWKSFAPDLSGSTFEINGVNMQDAYVVDNSFTLVVGELGLVQYSYQGGIAWPRIFGIEPTGSASVKAVYVAGNSNRAFFGYDNKVVWVDLSNIVYTDFDGFDVNSFNRGIIDLSGSGLVSIAGYGTTLWGIYGNKIFKCANATANPSSAQLSYSGSVEYSSINVLDENIICAIGGKYVSFTHNGGQTWTNVQVDGASATFNRVCLLDGSNALIVGNQGLFYYSTDGYYTWNPVPTSQLNISGNAERLLDSRYDLTNISCIDNANFYVSQTRKEYIPQFQIGNSSVFYLYLPNLFQPSQNYVLDISGSMCVAGDLKMSQNGSIISDTATFRLLNDTVKQLYVGGETDNIIMGGTRGNVQINNRLNISGNAQVGGQLTVVGNSHIQSSLSVQRDAYMNANIYVQSAAVIGQLEVSGNAVFDSDATVMGNLVLNGAVAVGSDILIGGEAEVRGNLWIDQDTTLYGILDVSSDIIARRDLTVLGDISLNGNVYNRHISFCNYYEGFVGGSSPDISIGGFNVAGYNSRNIRIGNFSPSIDTSNVIYLGGVKDRVVITGTVSQSTNISAGPIIYLNSSLDSSVGSGIKIGDNGKTDDGYIVISSDRAGYLLKPTDPSNANVIKLDIVNTVLPSTFTTGLVGITKLDPTTTGADYALSTCSIDPSNILLKNKTISTTGQQIIDSSFSVVGKMSVGTTTINANSALVVNGNIQHTNGYIWQF